MAKKLKYKTASGPDVYEVIGTDAAKVDIADVGNIITALNVEDALQELMNKLNSTQTTANNALPKTGGVATGLIEVQVAAGARGLGAHTTDPNIGVYLSAGNGDGATTATSNGYLESWNGIGIKDKSTGNVHAVIDTRTGNYVTDGTVIAGGVDLKSSVSNGKNSIASAITGKGVAASGSDDFTTLANKISQIAPAKRYASGTISLGGVGVTRIRGLAFQPSKVTISLSPTNSGAYVAFWLLMSAANDITNGWSAGGAVSAYARNSGTTAANHYGPINTGAAYTNDNFSIVPDGFNFYIYGSTTDPGATTYKWEAFE
jgi:hypothetical protein